MIFSSMVFIWLFLPIAIGAYYLTISLKWKTVSNIVLLLFSLFFYAWGEPVYILLMIISIMLNWIFGIMVDRTRSGKKYRGGILALAVLCNLAILGYFKYAGLLVKTVNLILHKDITVPEIALPIGISFFTFQAMSYVIDVYRNDCESERNVLNVALYISFFPQLIAGPIVKYRDVASQIQERLCSKDKFIYGIERFIIGLSKKVIIANTLAETVDRFYALDMKYITGLAVWCASLMYTLQIYYDFSGYSDMAIGLAKMFGFDFKENFNLPYVSHSIREFWRRWHISLSSWFKEYVYIPLGGNRKGTIKTYCNLLIVFFLTGLWHGASYNFVIWGLYHGAFIVMERILEGRLKLQIKPAIKWIYCVFVVNVGWVLFHEENVMKALAYIKRMMMPWRYTVGNRYVYQFMSPYLICITTCAILCSGIMKGIIERLNAGGVLTKRYHIAYQLVLIFLFVYSMLNLAGDTYNPFIYYRF